MPFFAKRRNISQNLLFGEFAIDNPLKFYNQRFRKNKKFEHKIGNIFLLTSFNICFGCSKELSH